MANVEGSIRSDLAAMHEYSVNIDTREIYLHGYYVSGDEVEEPGIDYRMASTFVKNLNLLNVINDGAILIHQHSIGGNWYDGIAIYDALKFSRCDTIMICYAEASSMSSITLQGAVHRVLMPNVEFLVHFGEQWVAGIPSQMKSTYKQLQRIDKTMLKIYSERCIYGEFFKKKKMTLKDITHYITSKIQKKTDWFMDAQEAVYFGFADAIMGQDGINNIEQLRQPAKKCKCHAKRKRN